MPVTGFFEPPISSRYALRRIHVPASLLPDAKLPGQGLDDIVSCDLVIEDGRIADVTPAGTVAEELGPDLDGSMVLPGLLDAHAHLDKGHIAPRASNRTGDLLGAAAVTGPDRAARWHAEDVYRRMSFGLRCAYAKGVVAIRTHLDSLAPQPSITFPVFRRLREEWAGRIELQPSTIQPLDVFLGEEGTQLADRVAELGGNLGSSTKFVTPMSSLVPPEFDQAMERIFTLAEERGLDLDLHVDEASDPEARTLIRIARLAEKRGFKGRILAGHCCALALQTDEFIEETMRACKEAGIDIVSLPAVNLYLQSRGPFGSNAPRRTPRWRGVTVLHELKACGLRVAIGGDNVRDPFYAYGDHDMLETFAQAVKIAHLDHPYDDWIRAVTAVPAAIMQLPQFGHVERGRPAHLVVLRARDFGEMLARFQADRVVIRHGKAIDTTLPDYRELDDLVRIEAATS
ncbi:cytosine deaminase [Enhydrobacter aerosaccus]|uniref:Cytosine deaminase n=1 Tax=Enhydrobacter aerosaccus TaxID=225324 RepID=A0A1T4T866_9HYPH|nr:cytosine deaminase [Enhydrobacter aerosaccus]SKA36664.1 cytosine deaminase [Enhydrobacter aerosaccus]